MKQLSKSFFIIFLFLFLFQNCTAAAESPEEIVNSYISEYGKKTMIEFILEIRNTQITIDINGEFQDNYGRPRKDYISTATILKDMEKMEMNVDTFSKELDNYLTKKNKKKKIIEKDSEQNKNDYGTGAITSRGEYNKLLRQCKKDCSKQTAACYDKTSKSDDKCIKSGASSKQCKDISDSSYDRCREKGSSCKDTCKESLRERYDSLSRYKK